MKTETDTRIIFFGSGQFAVGILEALHQKAGRIILVVTQPDRKKGRHLLLSKTPVKEYALRHGLEVFQPEDINGAETLEKLKKLNADVFLVVSYGRILSETVLSLARLAPVNIHASLLPKYRGAAPINRALMNGEKTTGVTFIKMNKRMDQGDIIFQKHLRIRRDDNAATLDKKLSLLASGYVKEVLDKIAGGRIRYKKQNEKKATYAPLLEKQDGLIHWEASAERILCSFRGCCGWPGSFTFYRGKYLKVLSMKKGKRCPPKALPGEITNITENSLEVACGRGSISIEEVLPEAHNKMPVKSFLAGHHVKIGEKLG